MALFIAGAGGFGRETLDAVMAAGETVVAFLDDQLAGRDCRGLPVVAPEDAPEGARFVVGIGDPRLRRELALRLAALGLVPATVVHPRAVIAPETSVASGCVILANAHVSSSVRLGAHVHVNYNATVGHDAVLEAYVTILPGANVAGAVHLAEGVTVGSNACVLPRRRVGAFTTVGAGAVVTRDLGTGQVAVGVPARPRDGSAHPVPTDR
ncbi:MAG TPA: NeuD/PglB/VioB family sugar acetyltransferase [Nitriliruptorales bacterium]|nr:NeuD/PglB/VioB family sugar acetyltransferase [Nitriliruptorales bacterium]